MFFVTFPSNMVKRIKGRRVLACKFFPSLFSFRKKQKSYKSESEREREKEKEKFVLV